MPRTRQVLLAGEPIRERHICVLYHHTDELFAQLEPLILGGFEDGDHELHLVEDGIAHRARLDALGVDVGGREGSGQLDVREWSDRFTAERPFSRQAMLAYVRHNLDAARGLGYQRTRWVATMEWALESFPGGSELIRFESQVDDLLRARRDVVVCAFDLERHSASVIAGILDTHDLALIEGVLRPRRTMTRASARERVLAAANDHFHNVGIRATGVDTLIDAAGVAKATFYRHFPSKDDLVVAWLRDGRPRWFNRVRDEAETPSRRAEDVIPAIFDGVVRWIEQDGFRGCAFQNAAVEITDSTHPARPVIREYFEEIDAYLRDALTRMGRRDAAERAAELGVLLSGGIASCVALQAAAPAIAARNAAIRSLDRP